MIQDQQISPFKTVNQPRFSSGLFNMNNSKFNSSNSKLINESSSKKQNFYNKDNKQIVSEVYKEDFSTNCKTFNSRVTSTVKKSCDKRNFVRPFGCNGFNLSNEAKKSIPTTSFSGINGNSNNEFNLNMNLRNITIENASINSTHNNFNLSNNLINSNGICSNSNKKNKKRILSSEEMLLEKIEKEKLKFEKLKKINKENIGRIFHNNTSNSISNLLNMNNNNIFSNNTNSFKEPLLSKKRDCSYLNDMNNHNVNRDKYLLINNLPSLLNSVTSNNKDSSNEMSSLKLNFEDDFLSITDTMSKLSVKNSPSKETNYNTGLFGNNNNKMQMKLNKKLAKEKEFKKQSALSRMNLSIFEKNTPLNDCNNNCNSMFFN